jgi:hypothetical protein
MTVKHIVDSPQSGWAVFYVAGNTTATANSLGSVLNPEGVLLQITDGFLYNVIDADAAATLDIGIGATGADSTDLVSAFDINGCAHGSVYYVIGKDAASEAAATTPKGLAWAATTYLNFYNPAAYSSENYEGYLFLRYIRVGDYGSLA